MGFPNATQFKPTGQVTYERPDGTIGSLVVAVSPNDSYPVTDILRKFFVKLRHPGYLPVKRDTPLLLKGTFQPVDVPDKYGSGSRKVGVEVEGFLRVSSDEWPAYNTPPGVNDVTNAASDVNSVLVFLATADDIHYGSVKLSAAQAKALLAEFERLRSGFTKSKEKVS